MRRRTRALLYAALCLCVPIPAFALSGDSEAPVNLNVKASLAGCGLASTEIVCQIDVTYDSAPDATRYTASVTRPDGSVLDQGTVGAGSATLWIPYAGDGDYMVEVSAYGKPEEPGDDEELLGSAEATVEEEPGPKSEAPEKDEDESAESSDKKGDEKEAEPKEPDCVPLDEEADALDREELAELEATAEATWEKAAAAETKDETKALEEKLLALGAEIDGLTARIEAREAAACPDGS